MSNKIPMKTLVINNIQYEIVDATARDKIQSIEEKNLMVVTIIGDPREGNATASHTPAEIYNYCNNGGCVVLDMGSGYIPLALVIESQANFEFHNGYRVWRFIVDSDRHLKFEEEIQVGRTDPDNGGTLFGDYENNKAGEFAVAFGSETTANGKGAIATGTKQDRSGAPEPPTDADWRYTTAAGEASMASGMGAVAFSRASKSLGYRTQTGYPKEEEKENYPTVNGYIHAPDTLTDKEKENVNAGNYGQAAVAIGSDTKALANNAFAAGYKSVASNVQTIAMGTNAEATGLQAIAIGTNMPYKDSAGRDRDAKVSASGRQSVAIGTGAQATGERSIALGFRTTADQTNQVVIGRLNESDENAVFIIGTGTSDDPDGDGESRYNSLVIDKQNKFTINNNNFSLNARDNINMDCSNAARLDCGGLAIHSMNDTQIKAQSDTNIESTTGNINIKTQYGHHDAQKVTITTAHFEAGDSVTASGNKAVALGYLSKALGNYSVVGGYNNKAETNYAISFGQSCTATGNSSIAIGANASTSAGASGSVALGSSVSARKAHSVAMGYGTDANAEYSIALGYLNETQALHSFAIGYGNKTAANYQAVMGKYNNYQNDAIKDEMFVIGNGTGAGAPSTGDRINIFTVDKQGNAKAAGAHTSMGADYAEMFEWQDGNLEAEDRIGYVVTLDSEKIRKAQSGDDILGIISGTAAMLGDSASMYWKNKYVTDEFGRIIYDEVEEFEELEDLETHEVTKISLGFAKHPRINPNYDPSEAYTPREQRPEWACVGMFGKLYVRDDNTCQVNGYAKIGENGILTHSEEKTNMRVLSRINTNIIKVLLK